MDTNPSLLTTRANLLTTTLQIASIFRGPADDWPYVTDITLETNRTLLVALYVDEYGTFADIASDTYNTAITTLANRLKSYQGPIVLRPWAKMNSD